jgi:hypothetical protein
MGETFEILASDVEKLVIFQQIGGPCRDRTYDQLIKRRSFYQVLIGLETISYRSRTVPYFAGLRGFKILIS